MAMTMERTISPMTSSITAAPMMILASTEFIRCRSLITLAVIPTEVATIAAPTNMASLLP